MKNWNSLDCFYVAFVNEINDFLIFKIIITIANNFKYFWSLILQSISACNFLWFFSNHFFCLNIKRLSKMKRAFAFVSYLFEWLFLYIIVSHFRLVYKVEKSINTLLIFYCKLFQAKFYTKMLKFDKVLIG